MKNGIFFVILLAKPTCLAIALSKAEEFFLFFH